ncbi:TetR/AcrR family transcriptional regulator [Cellulophaga baltica]|uniref:TetR/AcrR family transcriptional regulator n=1 Tax=Cellulophaga TaxID=104264 RepID=UPI001C07A012|nr:MULTISPECIES: TetR/AcrR family transcriptional regulator [Cellulophaga]MBU2997145.1 TetR/AcrR family transcriptional regulator [Cellulophaga baltica]MDO6768543.1 TetR/AcrR family transcriptional regulator [Cellulophaga sp. 1_MG-2023]
MDQRIKSEHTRHLIIEKSFLLFYENGFKTTSVDTIMKATKLTKGAFYHHFKNKSEIGHAVIAQKVQKRIHDSMIKPLYENKNAIELLKTTFSNRLKSFSSFEKEHGCPANNLINEIGDTEEGYQLALKEIINDWKKALILLIEKGKKENEIKKNINSEATAIYLISSFEGVRGIRKLYKDDTILDTYITGLTHYIEQLKK